MLEAPGGRQLQLVSPLTGEVTRRNDALLAATPPPLVRGAPLWLLDLAVCDDSEWDALDKAA
jgi:hypothetical protein